jgi:CDP-glucose 4,6-dehydratase
MVTYRLIDARGYYETKSLKLNSEKAHKVLGWEPKYNMADTIQRTAEWYRKFCNGLNTDELYIKEIQEYINGI